MKDKQIQIETLQGSESMVNDNDNNISNLGVQAEPQAEPTKESEPEPAEPNLVQLVQTLKFAKMNLRKKQLAKIVDREKHLENLLKANVEFERLNEQVKEKIETLDLNIDLDMINYFQWLIKNKEALENFKLRIELEKSITPKYDFVEEFAQAGLTIPKTKTLESSESSEYFKIVAKKYSELAGAGFDHEIAVLRMENNKGEEVHFSDTIKTVSETDKIRFSLSLVQSNTKNVYKFYIRLKEGQLRFNYNDLYFNTGALKVINEKLAGFLNTYKLKKFETLFPAFFEDVKALASKKTEAKQTYSEKNKLSIFNLIASEKLELRDELNDIFVGFDIEPIEFENVGSFESYKNLIKIKIDNFMADENVSKEEKDDFIKSLHAKFVN